MDAFSNNGHDKPNQFTALQSTHAKPCQVERLKHCHGLGITNSGAHQHRHKVQTQLWKPDNPKQLPKTLISEDQICQIVGANPPPRELNPRMELLSDSHDNRNGHGWRYESAQQHDEPAYTLGLLGHTPQAGMSSSLRNSRVDFASGTKQYMA